MRAKKTNIKTGKITRTIPFTNVKFLTVDVESREVNEETLILALEYNKDEAENVLRELGYNVAAVLEVVPYEQKLAISYEDFIKYAYIDE